MIVAPIGIPGGSSLLRVERRNFFFFFCGAVLRSAKKSTANRAYNDWSFLLFTHLLLELRLGLRNLGGRFPSRGVGSRVVGSQEGGGGGGLLASAVNGVVVTLLPLLKCNYYLRNCVYQNALVSVPEFPELGIRAPSWELGRERSLE